MKKCKENILLSHYTEYDIYRKIDFNLPRQRGILRDLDNSLNKTNSDILKIVKLFNNFDRIYLYKYLYKYTEDKSYFNNIDIQKDERGYYIDISKKMYIKSNIDKYKYINWRTVTRNLSSFISDYGLLRRNNFYDVISSFYGDTLSFSFHHINIYFDLGVCEYCSIYNIFIDYDKTIKYLYQTFDKNIEQI